jgi:pilus assembly protein CpaE
MSDKIRVIIVDDIAETRENIRKLLQFESDIEVVGVARTGREGIDLTEEISPDVVLMDINMPDMDGITATETIRKEVPFAQIVILSVQGDPNYMRRAMLAGARDFLTKPPMVDELISAIRRAGKMAHDEREKSSAKYQSQTTTPGLAGARSGAAPMGDVIIIYSPKGGVGCTTVAINLGVALQNSETPVVIVDGNLQFGDVAVMLNERSRNSIMDLAPRADELDPEVVENVLVTHSDSGVKILTAPSRPEYAENVTGDQFSKVIKYLRQMYSYVVVDTSSSLTDVVLSAMDASNLVILIVTQDIPAINNSRLFLDLADVIGIDRKNIIFVMNRYDKRIAITPEKVGENLHQEIVTVLPNDERSVVPSVNRGVPFILSSKGRSSPISKSIFELAEIVRQRIATAEDK